MRHIDEIVPLPVCHYIIARVNEATEPLFTGKPDNIFGENLV